jgi:hypothetical protein
LYELMMLSTRSERGALEASIPVAPTFTRS